MGSQKGKTRFYVKKKRLHAKEAGTGEMIKGEKMLVGRGGKGKFAEKA